MNRLPFGLRSKLAAVLAAVGVVVVLTGVVLPTMAGATKPNPEHKVTLCHATRSYSNPYVEITVDIASVLQSGHGGHEGPLFDPSLPKHTRWGDIIPPFDFGPDAQYAGMNWTDGETILLAGCEAGDIPTTTTTESTTTTSTAGA